MSSEKLCVVIGAGIVGLSTAVCLQAKGYRVTIIADRFASDTTSHVAGGVFLPYNRNVLGKGRRQEAVEVVKRSWNNYKKIHTQVEEQHGVNMVFGYQCYFTRDVYGEPLPDQPLVWEVADVYREMTRAELKQMSPDTPCSGWIIQTYIIQCRYYLPYLMSLFLSSGGKLVEKHLKSFDEVMECDVVVNCAGLGARQLCLDSSVKPAQGQIAHVHATQLKHFFHCEEVYDKPPESRQLLYFLPQIGHVVLGGTFLEEDDSTLVKESTRKEFLAKLCHAAPTLKNCEVVEEKCGVRPCRDTIRLEAEQITLTSGRYLKVVHNYGHGGNGVALSWGTAELAAGMVERLFNSISKL